jgi:putative ABC transport system ATP-binding protein
MNRGVIMSEYIKIENLYKSFGKVDVLNGINLTIDKGEFVSIMGASGSGKSTLLYLMGGLERPTSGNVFIDGNNISEMKDKEESLLRRRTMNYIFQFYNLVPNLSVEDNILLPIVLDGRKVKEYEDKLNEVLDIVGLKEFRKFIPAELSGGQQQRVAIARTLLSDSDIILADEATGNLDSKASKEILELFKKINKEKNKTIIQVTHSEEAASYGNRLICIKDGKII